MLGHRKRRTTAIYAHLDVAALQGAAAQAAAVIAGAMGYKAAPPPLPDGTDGGEDGETPDTPAAGEAGAARPAPPDKPPAHGLRRLSDWDRPVPARSEPSGPAVGRDPPGSGNFNDDQFYQCNKYYLSPISWCHTVLTCAHVLSYFTGAAAVQRLVDRLSGAGDPRAGPEPGERECVIEPRRCELEVR